MTLAAAVPALLTLGMSGVAQAAPSVSPPACPSATFCTYQNANFDVSGGAYWYYSFNNHSDGKWFYVGNAQNDQISSINNSRVWYSYVSLDCPAGGTWLGISGGSKLSDLSQAPYSQWNDAISGIAFATSASQGANHFPAHGPHC
jgi:hypothetical protein